MPRRVLSGVVTSAVRNKTITVLVTRRVMHPKYKKYINVRKKFHAHDENNVCKVGDKVEILESPPISKTKKWVLVESSVVRC